MLRLAVGLVNWTQGVEGRAASGDDVTSFFFTHMLAASKTSCVGRRFSLVIFVFTYPSNQGTPMYPEAPVFGRVTSGTPVQELPCVRLGWRAHDKCRNIEKEEERDNERCPVKVLE